MKSSNTNARTAVSGSTEFPWKWSLSELEKRPKHGHTVFSCFSCGGGSSMGYKLAGFDVMGNCEIDPDMMKVYKQNNHPKHSFLMDIRDFLKLPDEKIPEELFHMDVLDGSPPCSVFSTAGVREEGWNTEKVFREGQAKQRLDDLFFFFIAHRKDLDYPKLVMNFNSKPIPFGDVREPYGKSMDENSLQAKLLKYRIPSDRCIADINARVRGKKNSGFTTPILSDDEPAYTIVSGSSLYRMCDGLLLTDKDIISCQTFPQDYDFMDQSVQYICGMSVPPVMMAKISEQVYRQWLKGGDAD